MESFSDNLKIQLKMFLQLWLQEKGEFQELQVIPTHIMLETPEKIESIEYKRFYKLTNDKEILRYVVESFSDP
jgi:hypothetical protein